MKIDLRPRIVFITGTDTGIGKTLLTALLLSHLRQTRKPALAIKPFCSGGRGDAELLHALQDGDLSLDEINPFHFSEPLAPLVAARKHNQRISLQSVIKHVHSLAARLAPQEIKVQSSKCKVRSSVRPLQLNPLPSTLLIEGAGGLLAPLGEGFSLLNLIDALQPKKRPKSGIQHPASSIEIIIVSANRLGTINHTLLAIQALRSRNLGALKVVLMDILPPQQSTLDTRSNPSILAEVISPIPLFHLPNLSKNPSKLAQIGTFAKKLKKTLAQILG